ncbi:outer membrane beta-barrel protein [Marivirga salinae]|uniref:Outer membrane beta-barrel protein n=1 Tax=Marivirga salinarum TaxID=3059078 RepID=A0AA51RBX8_9BACT|nr:outer membrane beta-barrel protein [Marivirga sp. BDSF4-3]WMN10998.1 outer membrane beta-barrel protein [Marivirga sp. BDSF4-3]
MKTATLFLSISVSLFAFKANSQSKFYISTEGNFNYDLYQVTDEGNSAGPPIFRLIAPPGATFIAGYELNSIFSLETGIAIHPVKSGFSLVFSDHGSVSEGTYEGEYYHIPIRTRVRIPLFSDWLFATTSLGVQLSVTNPAQVGTTSTIDGSQGSSTINGDRLYSVSTQNTYYHKYYLTASVETGFDFQISPKFNMYSTFTYNRGFTDLRQTDIQYQYKNEPEREASIFHQGSYLSVNIGLRFHLNAG